jgi:hypothetical protein
MILRDGKNSVVKITSVVIMSVSDSSNLNQAALGPTTGSMEQQQVGSSRESARRLTCSDIPATLPQYSACDSYESLIGFLSSHALRPTKPIEIVPKLVEEPRAAHLTPLVPGRASEDVKRDSSIDFGYRLFRKSLNPDRRRFLSREPFVPTDPLIAALFIEDDSIDSPPDN